MKLLFLIIVAFAVSIFTYLAIYLFLKKQKKNRYKKPLAAALAVLVLLCGLIALGVYVSSHQPDIQCSTSHQTATEPPANLQTAQDFFELGNYDYDAGNCQKAVGDYSKAIEMNPEFAQAYNNRAYTNMRLRNYKDALADLDKTLSINPNYIQALMNRGDIHNYYFEIDRNAAIADYKKVISIVGPGGGETSVCGHLFLAKHNGWTLSAFVDFFNGKFRSCS